MVTAKSVILDIADNWGDTYLSLRSVDFYFEESLLPLTSSDFTAYATTQLDAARGPQYVFDTTASKIGVNNYTEWCSTSGSKTNQRLIVIFNTHQTFDRIVINNSHYSGGYTTRGVKNVVFTASDDAITSTVYGAAISNSTELLDIELPIHASVNAADDNIYDIEDVIITVVIYAELSQQYSINTGDVLAALLSQLYSISEDVGEVALEQFWSILLEIWLSQPYRGVPILTRTLLQSYRSAPILFKALVQRWQDALGMELALEQGWSLPELLAAISEQRYGLAAAVLSKTSEQLYHINELSTLFAGLSQPYAIAGEAAQRYSFDCRLYVDGVRIPYHALEWQATDSEYCLSCDFSVKSAEVAARCVDGAEIRIESGGDTYYLKCYDGWQLDKRHGSTVYRITGYSKTRDLDLAEPLLGDIDGGMASAIIAGIAADYDIEVDYLMEDGFIGDTKLVANNETPLAVIRKLAEDGGGRMATSEDGRLLIVAESETGIPLWPSATPVQTIEARLERRTTSEQYDIQAGYNAFLVSDQLAAADSHSLVQEVVDSQTVELRLYRTPLDTSEEYLLEHTGGSQVTIEPFGLASEVIEDELVEIVAGSGRTSLPIYGLVSYSWQQAGLGSIVFSEDGTIESELAEYSLLQISYTTRYYRWLGRDTNIEDVQFVASLVEDAS